MGIYETGDSPFAGLILDLQVLQYVEPEGSCHLPQQPELAGRLRMFTADQFAAFLLDLPVQRDANLDAVQVSAHVLTFKDVLPRRVMILGTDSIFDSLL